MGKLLDRVARALFEHDQLKDEAKLDDWDAFWETTKDGYYSLARAAIQAVRQSALRDDDWSDDDLQPPGQRQQE